MSERPEHRAPVCGTCERCGCPLGLAASPKDGTWYCCGPCAGSNRCTCGCKPDLARDVDSDVYVPGRRMFGSRHPDELKTDPERRDHIRAFPFEDSQRGR